MNLSLIRIVILLGAGALNSANAQVLAPIKIIEKSIETTSFSVSLPASVPARLVARACTNCTASTLSITGKSRFFIGVEEVSYAAFLNAGRARSRFMTIHYAPETFEITRLLMSDRL